MLRYHPGLKRKARELRSNMTDCEQKLWTRLRGKQIQGIPFYRQKPIGNYIVDFYAPKAKLVIEVDGGQHYDFPQVHKDKKRDAFLAREGSRVLRFSDIEVLQETNAVVEQIYEVVSERRLNPPSAPFYKGGETEGFPGIAEIDSMTVDCGLLTVD